MYSGPMGGARVCEVLGIAALLTGGLGCDTASESADTLYDHEQAWHAQEPERYVVQTCTVGIEPPGCVRAVVDVHGVTAAEERIFDPGAPSWEVISLGRKPLDDMYDQLRAGLQQGCALDELQYDDDLGYVDTYTLDCGEGVTEGRWVACFEADAAALDACDEEP